MSLLSSIIHKIKRRTAITQISRHRAGKIGVGFKLGNYANFLLDPQAKQILIEEKCSFRNYINIVVGKNAELKIASNVFLNNYCSINCLEKIEIGENTLFGEGVKLYDHNHEYSAEKVEHRKFTTAPIKIGKNCWLGSNVTVLKGVTIGDNTIIGANCLIYKDIPANSLIKNKTELLIQEKH